MKQSVYKSIPLCVDLDNTLVMSDLLLENILNSVKKRPQTLLIMPWWLLRGRQYFKHKVEEHTNIAFEMLPYREEVLELIGKKKREGASVYLVSANTQKNVHGVCKYLNLFDGYFCSDHQKNLKGAIKSKFLTQRFGEKKFDYVGDHLCDFEVFRYSKNAYFVGNASVGKILRNKGIQFEQNYSTGRVSMREFFRAIRIHQWLKNILIFLPLLLSHKIFEVEKFHHALVAFFCMSLTASATYIINDLFDIESDRAHPEKKNRPFASGKIQIKTGVLLSMLLLSGALVVSFFESVALCKLLFIYTAITLFYSLYLKSIAILDVIVLAFLYTHRIIIGSVITNIRLSEWLFSFSIFLFFSLGFLKRNNEILKKNQSKEGNGQNVLGRGYLVSDLEIIQIFGVSAGVCSVLIFVLYINSEAMSALYQVKYWLWLIAPLLLFWVGRIWLKAARGLIDEDPIVFTMKDTKGYLIFVFIIACLVLSKYGIQVL
ncbi:MAG: UbiA family prenyltransferase [Deltaproteobacteria bacterium]|nr:UbiA family prenyltransferase [Deltaproteobacteria bacterium]